MPELPPPEPARPGGAPEEAPEPTREPAPEGGAGFEVLILPAPPRFETGRVVATPGAMEALEAAGSSGLELLGRHMTGDWGELDPEDAAANDRALRDGERLLSAYTLATGVKVWVITEWDRSATTLLLPSDY